MASALAVARERGAVVVQRGGVHEEQVTLPVAVEIRDADRPRGVFEVELTGSKGVGNVQGEPAFVWTGRLCA